ncbi:MAG: exodeoxyribonuclease VII small subunit [Verrucomicrobia bacterium]|nr:MAG: exodeoxyribonuclease VII small subunit [Verrucomicrobiota bacterium]
MSENNKENNLSFEEALKQLETIVASMETGDIPLEELVSKFQEGDALLKFCNKQLSRAELKIEKLKVNAEKEFEEFATEDS